MELFIFIVFQLLTEVQSNNSLPKPFISVSDDGVLLGISCEIPLSVRTDFICSFYTEDDVLLYQRVSQWSQSGKNLCVFYSSRSELFPRSVNSRQLICVYSLKTEPEIRSPHSDTYTFRDTYTIRDTMTIRASTPTTTKHTTTTTAMKTLDVQSKTSPPTSKAKETQTALNVMSTSETTTYSKTDVQSKTSLSTSKAKETKTVLNVMSTSETTKYSKTVDFQSKSNLPTSTATETMELWYIVLGSTGIAVILSGLICFCRFASKKRRKLNKTRSNKPDVTSQEIGMSCSGPAETYCLITSVPSTSQPISEGLEQDSTADPKDSYSFITSVNSIYQPPDVLVNKQQKQGNTEENENVYHLYCTIPDKPVNSNTEDHVYSLVKMH